MSVYNKNMYTFMYVWMCVASTFIRSFLERLTVINVSISYVVISQMSANIETLLISNVITCSSCYLLSNH